MLSHVPYSRRYVAVPYFTFAFLIGFLAWQICVKLGLSLRDDQIVLLRLFAQTLIWGCLVYALAATALLSAVVWTLSTRLDFSLQRKKQQMKLSLVFFIGGICLSVFGIVMNLTDTPPLDALYIPLHRLDL